MGLVTELELPVLDVMDPALRGPRLHEVMREDSRIIAQLTPGELARRVREVIDGDRQPAAS